MAPTINVREDSMPTPIFTVTVSDAANTPFELVAFTGREAISQLFQFELALKLPNAVAKDLTPDTIIHAPIALQVQYSDNYEETSPGKTHIINGFVQSLYREYKSSATHHYYRAVMVPNAAIMGKNQTYDIFEGIRIDSILAEKCLPYSGKGVRMEMANMDAMYPDRHFVCQYAESDFDFIARQAAYWGIRFRINHHRGGLLEFADVVEIEDEQLKSKKGWISSAKLVDVFSTDNRYLSVYELRSDYGAVTEKVVVSETTSHNSGKPIRVKTNDNKDEVGEYSLHLTNEGCDNEEEAKFIAKIRLEEQQTYRTRFQGATGIPVLTPGFILTVECNEQKERILITEVQHRANNLDTQTRAAASSDGDYYEAIFVGIPADHQYRPAYSQQMRPRVISTTARIYAAGFKEESKKEKSENSHSMIAERNDLGMYRVVFDFMLARKEDTVRPSNWMRLARPTARTNHFDMPLTPGTEVQVAFIDGNPDRPYIQCALENSRSLITPV